jgi:hypothetical protein
MTHDVTEARKLRDAHAAESRPEENPADDWRAESDGLGELLVFCPECWQREFGSSA